MNPPDFYTKILGSRMNRAGSCLHWELSPNKIYSCLGSLHIAQGHPRKCQMRSFCFHWDKIRLGLLSQKSAIEGPGHQHHNVAVPTDLPAEYFSRDSGASCQLYHSVPVLRSMWLSAYPGFAFWSFCTQLVILAPLPPTSPIIWFSGSRS